MGKILVTGGTGFIGSHTCVALTNAGYSVVVMDNLVNSKVESIARIEMITGKHIRFYRTDMLDEKIIVRQPYSRITRRRDSVPLMLLW